MNKTSEQFRSEKVIKLAYIVTHPIHHQVPLLREISKDPNIDLKVFFCSDVSFSDYVAVGYVDPVKWGVPLSEGYKYDILPSFGSNKKINTWRPINYGIFSRLKKEKFDVLWVHGYSRWFNWVAILSAKLLGVKVLLRDEATAVSAQRSKIKYFFKKSFFKGLNYFVDGFTAIGTLNKQYYLENGISDQKIFMTPYTVDNDFFQDRVKHISRDREKLREILSLEKDCPVILFVSRLIKRKCVNDLITAFAKTIEKNANSAYLLIIGDGQDAQETIDKIKEINLPSIKFLGFKSQAELPQYYDLADIFVLPSYDEPWGLVINEAMNAGCAIIASQEVGAAADLVHEGVNGFMFPARNIDALTEVLEKVLSLYSEMGKESIEIINHWSFCETISGLKQAIFVALKKRQ